MIPAGIVTIGGLIATLVGAWLVAIELVIRFRGYAFRVKSVTYNGTDGEVGKTDEFRKWELRRAKFMWAGLLLITAGTIAQIVGVALAV